MENKKTKIAEVEKCGIKFTLSSSENEVKKWLIIEAYNTKTQEECGFVLLNEKTEVDHQCGIFDYAGSREVYEFIENELFKTEVGKWADNLDRATTR